MRPPLHLTVRAAVLWPLKLLKPQTPLEHDAVREILVLCPDKLGEALPALSFLKNLRTLFPQATITLFAGPFIQQLLTDEFYRIIPSQGPQAALNIPAASFDLAVDLHCGPELASAKLCAATQVRWRAGLDIAGRGYLFNVRAQAEPGLSQEKALQALLGALGSDEPLLQHKLNLYPEDFAAAQARLVLEGLPEGPFVAVHAGGRDENKRWPAEKFAELMNILHAWHGVCFVLLGSVEEKEYLLELGKAAGVTALAAAGLNLRVAAALIAKSALFIGNDSGPLQLACALGAPALSLTATEQAEPADARYAALCSRHLKEIPVAEMAQTADRLLSGIQSTNK